MAHTEEFVMVPWHFPDAARVLGANGIDTTGLPVQADGAALQREHVATHRIEGKQTEEACCGEGNQCANNRARPVPALHHHFARVSEWTRSCEHTKKEK
ncbi:hypothetical protein FQZ97_1102330 [compost metagenome]